MSAALSQTLLTLVFEEDITRQDAIEFSRHVATRLSARKGIASCRMQVFVGERLTDRDAREIAERDPIA